ncbi:Neuroligin 1 [Carabus blaptoides fortunei]
MAFQVLIIVFTCIALCWARFDYGYNPSAKRYTQPAISIKQGRLQGVVVEPRGVRGCEQYLGIPYAAPPVGELRFMPPGSAPPWTNELYADSLGPVCPQRMPDMKGMSSDRKEKFKKLSAYLRNQSEDCLYLNIYAPIREPYQRSRKLPVMVFIHGEGYDWNSGNPYDGCVLSSYGNVIFITFNFRLGILGFLKAGISDQARSNFGLVDQVAALLWVQENIAAFGGDPKSVTLIGHGTGAACVNFLMISPMVSRGADDALFKRAILMSGSALADWALASKSLQLTTQVAHILNCPLKDDGLAECLRRKRLSEIMSVSLMASPYVTKFGPIVDGLVVPNYPKLLMSKYNDLFSRYEMMFGISEIESDHLLGNVALLHGLLEEERNDILRKYLEARFEYQPNTALASTLNARVAAPVVQTGNFHSAVNPKSYFYVFGHSTISRDILREKSLHGEELPYLLGAPLGGSQNLYSNHYTEEEKLFSEIIMTLWSNFAHTGNPIARLGNSFLTLSPEDWRRNWPKYWPEYESKNQSHKTTPFPYRTPPAIFQPGPPEILSNHTDTIPVRPRPKATPFPYRPPPPIFQPNPHNTGRPSVWSNKNSHTTAAPVFGSVKTDGNIFEIRTDEVAKIITSEPEPETSNTTINILIVVGGLFLLVNVLTFAGLYYKRRRLRKQERNLKRQYEDTNLLTTSDASPEKKPRIDGNIDPEIPREGCNVMRMIRQSTTRSEDTYEAVIKQSEESSNSNPRLKVARQISTSTIDPHTKVRDWIAHEIVQRCSPRFLRRTRQQFALEHKLNQEQEKKKVKKTSDTKTLMSNTTTTKTSSRPISPLGKNSSSLSTQKTSLKHSSNKLNTTSTTGMRKPRKISVAIDATPAGRGSSVLKQQPIELSKSMDLTREKEVRILRRSVTMDDFSTVNQKPTLRRSITNVDFNSEPTIDHKSITLISEPAPETSDIIKIHHQHFRSDPVQTSLGTSLENSSHGTLKMKTFDINQDVNVTSRDESISAGPPMSPEEALQTIKRRNFPKVLPDFPDHQSQSNSLKRRSLPPQNLLIFPPNSDYRKVQPNSPNTLKSFSRIPPAPPPRSSSTLGRKPSNASPLCNPSQVKLAEEPPLPEEPTITSNTLHVGPLIPCRQPHRAMDHNNGTQSYKLNTQPIYDNLRAPPNKEAVTDTKKTVPKTIITTDPNNPVKKIEQPKVIIKPSISRKANDPSKVNKVIPRVIAKDLSTEYEPGVEDPSNSEYNVNGVKSQPSQKSKLTRIPTFKHSTPSKSQSSSDSSSSTLDGSDTGTVVKREK